MMRIIYTTDVFCPQPFEALRIEVVLQDVGIPVKLNAYSGGNPNGVPG